MMRVCEITGLRCAYCKTVERTDCKLLSCSRCMNVRYCNAACQCADWAAHKEWCKQKAADMVAANAPDAVHQSREVEWCKCFDETTLRIYNKSVHGQCCGRECDVYVGGSVYDTMCVVQCKLPRHYAKKKTRDHRLQTRSKEKLLHLIAITYCSDHCLKHSMKESSTLMKVLE
jgi:hypothetical protein